MLKKIKKFISQDYIIAIALFLLAGLIRTIPEIKAGIWPIGYDTFNTYASELVTYHGPLINWLKTANLIYFIFLPFVRLGVDPGFLMKIFGPIIFGALTVSFYFWARSFIGLNKIKSLLAGFLIIFQLATLRMSWDLYRNELGLIFLFWALVNLIKIEKRKNLILTVLFSILVGVSNELVTAMLLIVLFFYLLFLLLKKKHQLSLRVAAPFIVLAILFWLVIHSPAQSLYSANVFFIANNDNRVWRYFYQYQNDLSYQELRSIIGRLFWLLYQYLLPFVLLGFWFLRKNFILTVLTIWLLAGTFSALLMGGTGIIVWDRWLWMLAYPFAVYSVEGIFQTGRFINQKLKKWHLLLRPATLTAGIIFWLGLIGLLIGRALPFLTSAYADAKPPLKDEELNSYFPPTMVHNSVGIWKIESTFDCIGWLDKNVPSGAVVLVDNRYRGLMLTNFEMDNRYIITNNWSDNWPKKSFEFAKKKGFKDIYLIWPVMPIRGFDKVYSSGNLNVYKAKPY